MPATRRAMVRIILSVAILALLLIIGIVAAAWPRASRTLPPTDYITQYQQQLTPISEGDDNGWDAARAAADVWIQIAARHGPDATRFDGGRAADGSFIIGRPSRELLAALDASGVPAMLDRLVAAPAIRPDIGAPRVLDELSRVDLPPFRGLARAESARITLASEHGDTAAAARSFDRMLALARACEAWPGLIGALSGTAIRALAFEALHTALTHHRLEPTNLRACLNSIDRHPPPTLESTFDAERLMVLDAIQADYQSNDHGLPRGVARLLRASHDQIVQRTDAYFDALRAALRTPEGQRLAAARALEDDLNKLGDRWYLLTRHVPNVSGPIRINTEIRMAHDAARIALALELFHADHQRYPSTLAELVPTYLPSIPTDAAASGTPLSYRILTPEESQRDGRRYLIYSLGFDAIDQHGLEPPTGAVQSYTRPDGSTATRPVLATDTPGYDHVFNRARPLAAPVP